MASTTMICSSLPFKIFNVLLALLMFSSFQWQTTTATRASVKLLKEAVQAICYQSRNPDFCIDVLSNDPRTEYASLDNIESVALNLAFISAGKTTDFINDLLQRVPVGMEKDRVETCKKCYSNAHDDLEQATERYGDNDYASVLVWAEKAQNQSTKCQSIWDVPPPIASPLTSNNKEFGDLASIVAVIAKEHVKH